VLGRRAPAVRGPAWWLEGSLRCRDRACETSHPAAVHPRLGLCRAVTARPAPRPTAPTPCRTRV